MNESTRKKRENLRAVVLLCQFDLLPVGFTITDAKTIRTEKGILFQSEHSFPSSFYVEHGYNYTCATCSDRPDITELITKATTPQEAKRLGKLVPESAEFKKNKDQLMEALHYEKLTQKPELSWSIQATPTC